MSTKKRKSPEAAEPTRPAKQRPSAPIDASQRYTIPEAAQYLRICRAYIYQLMDRGELRSLTDGKRRFIPGAEIVRRSTLPAARAGTNR